MAFLYYHKAEKKKKLCFCNMSRTKWVCRSGFYFIFFNFSFFPQLKCTFLAVINMPHTHRFCIYQGKRKLKLLIIVSANFVLLMSKHRFLFCFSYIFWKIWKKKRFYSRRVLERVGPVLVNTACFFSAYFSLSILDLRETKVGPKLLS